MSTTNNMSEQKTYTSYIFTGRNFSPSCQMRKEITKTEIFKKIAKIQIRILKQEFSYRGLVHCSLLTLATIRDTTPSLQRLWAHSDLYNQNPATFPLKST